MGWYRLAVVARGAKVARVTPWWKCALAEVGRTVLSGWTVELGIQVEGGGEVVKLLSWCTEFRAFPEDMVSITIGLSTEHAC